MTADWHPLGSASDAPISDPLCAVTAHGPRPEQCEHPFVDQQSLVSDAMVTIPKTLGAATTLKELREFFGDDHVHMALVVNANAELLTAIERTDLLLARGAERAVELGTLGPRIVSPALSLVAATEKLAERRSRRLAVVDQSGKLVGLLCLKRDGSGFCSDDGIRQHAESMQTS